MSLLAGVGAMIASGVVHATPSRVILMQQAARSTNQMGIDALAYITDQSGLENSNYSPASMALAFALAQAGAKGSTEQALSALLMGGRFGEDATLGGYSQLKKKLVESSSDGFRLHVANAVFAREGSGLLTEYKERVQKALDSSAHELDFGSLDANRSINQWVNANTQGKIPELVSSTEPLSRDLVALLVNAVYLKAKWLSPFNQALTAQRSFQAVLPNGERTQRSVPMMNGSGHFHYLSMDGVQAIELPYQGEAASMFFVLPAKGQEVLDARQLEEVVAHVSKDPELKLGKLSLPKFKFEASYDLTNFYRDSAAGQAFTSGADFSRMFQAPVAISSVIQKTMIAVDENGTEAAAVSSIGIGRTSVPRYVFDLKLDRPFYFVLKHKLTDTTLFLGRVINPTL
jgi:serpin B